jgi:ApaG protein
VSSSTKNFEISVSAETQYIPEQSDEAIPRYVFSYSITIRNNGSAPAQLMRRHWTITDENNQVRYVQGLGVLGLQPLIPPGGQFQYTSGTAFTTPTGSMQGKYDMVGAGDTEQSVVIPKFTFSVPRVLH